ncbi:hypothetical protein IJG91_02410 [Candidatus Saccharibacteria bacterium]|nr:hypothetical protein [Candidatus Saccharibacteria bacterium]
MEDSLPKKKDEKVNTLIDDAKDAADKGDNTQIQLSNNLISITLAFVALLATAISTSSVLPTIDFSQKILIMIAIVVFCVSIFVGLTNFYLNMRHHQKTAKIDRKKAQKAGTIKSTEKLDNVERTEVTVTVPSSVKRNNALILTQVVLLMIGLVFCVMFIGTILFGTSNKI